MLDPRRLAVLREFAARGTIALAADALAFTPSAVSQQLAQLQREAGVALFRKVGRRLELTDAGRTLVARADELLARIEEIDAELAAQAQEVSGTVRVGAFQTAASAIVIPALDRIAQRHPRLRVELLESEAEESLPVLARGGLDVAIAEEYEHAPRPRSAQLRREYLEPDEMVLALPRGHAAAKGNRPVSLASLHAIEWVAARAETAFGDMFVRRGVRAREPPSRQRDGAAARRRRRRWRRGARPRARPAGARRPRGRPPHRRGPLYPGALRRRARERSVAAVDRGGGRRDQRSVSGSRTHDSPPVDQSVRM